MIQSHLHINCYEAGKSAVTAGFGMLPCFRQPISVSYRSSRVSSEVLLLSLIYSISPIKVQVIILTGHLTFLVSGLPCYLTPNLFVMKSVLNSSLPIIGKAKL